MAVNPAAPPHQGPIFIPVPIPMAQPPNPLDFTDEEIDEERRDRREVREERRDERQVRKSERRYRHLEVGGNPVGVVGFAFAVTTVVLVMAGMIFHKDLKFYTGVAGVLGFPGALAALICGIIGCTRPGRPKLLAGIAACAGGLVLLVFLPLLWLLLLGTNK